RSTGHPSHPVDPLAQVLSETFTAALIGKEMSAEGLLLLSELYRRFRDGPMAARAQQGAAPPGASAQLSARFPSPHVVPAFPVTGIKILVLPLKPLRAGTTDPLDAQMDEAVRGLASDPVVANGFVLRWNAIADRVHALDEAGSSGGGEASGSSITLYLD